MISFLLLLSYQILLLIRYNGVLVVAVVDTDTFDIVNNGTVEKGASHVPLKCCNNRRRCQTFTLMSCYPGGVEEHQQYIMYYSYEFLSVHKS